MVYYRHTKPQYDKEGAPAMTPVSNDAVMNIRIPQSLKDRLMKATDTINTLTPGARYSANSLARVAIEAKIEEIERLARDTQDKK
jgi:predicted DNA-binding protein